jgi:hypothetical protein
MTDDEIRRQLRLIKSTPKTRRCGRKATSLNKIALEAGLSRRALYNIIDGHPIGDKARAGLRLAFRREVHDGEKSDVRPCDEISPRSAQPAWTFSSNALISRAFASTGVPKKRRPFR